MVKTVRRNQKGFTLVEVIVVAVIVAVLAAVAIPLYLNYVKDSRTNAAENVAGSAASFCAACINSSGTFVAAARPIVCTSTSGTTTTFTVPTNITLTVSGNTTGSTCTAVHTATGSVASNAYSF